MLLGVDPREGLIDLVEPMRHVRVSIGGGGTDSELARDVGAAEAAQIASAVQSHVEAVRRWMETD